MRRCLRHVTGITWSIVSVLASARQKRGQLAGCLVCQVRHIGVFVICQAPEVNVSRLTELPLSFWESCTPSNQLIELSATPPFGRPAPFDFVLRTCRPRDFARPRTLVFLVGAETRDRSTRRVHSETLVCCISLTPTMVRFLAQILIFHNFLKCKWLFSITVRDCPQGGYSWWPTSYLQASQA